MEGENWKPGPGVWRHPGRKGIVFLRTRECLSLSASTYFLSSSLQVEALFRLNSCSDTGLTDTLLLTSPSWVSSVPPPPPLVLVGVHGSHGFQTTLFSFSLPCNCHLTAWSLSVSGQFYFWSDFLPLLLVLLDMVSVTKCIYLNVTQDTIAMTLQAAG